MYPMHRIPSSHWYWCLEQLSSRWLGLSGLLELAQSGWPAPNEQKKACVPGYCWSKSQQEAPLTDQAKKFKCWNMLKPTLHPALPVQAVFFGLPASFGSFVGAGGAGADGLGAEGAIPDAETGRNSHGSCKAGRHWISNRNPRLHMAPLSWRTSLLLQPAQSKLQIIHNHPLTVRCSLFTAVGAGGFGASWFDPPVFGEDQIPPNRSKQDWHATKSYKVWKTYVGPLGVPAVSVIFSDAKPVEGN